MSRRYRKIDPRFWKDEKVRQLPPMGKLILLYLFTGGQSNRVGFYSFSRGQGSEDTGMAPRTFRRHFQDLWIPDGDGVGPGHRPFFINFDSAQAVVMLPTWWRYNPPENPNVLKGCLEDLHDLPQSPLWNTFMESSILHLPETLGVTFRSEMAKRYPKRLPNQEQEQEQEPKKDLPSPSSPDPTSPPRARKGTGGRPPGGTKRARKTRGTSPAEPLPTESDPDVCDVCPKDGEFWGAIVVGGRIKTTHDCPRGRRRKAVLTGDLKGVRESERRREADSVNPRDNRGPTRIGDVIDLESLGKESSGGEEGT